MKNEGKRGGGNKRRKEKKHKVKSEEKGKQSKRTRGKKNKMMGRKKKTKRRVFMRCHMNSLALVEFTWPCQMAIKMDLVTTKFDHHHWMVNKMGLIIGIRFDCCHQMEIEKGGI
jgi:hypothetical protein